MTISSISKESLALILLWTLLDGRRPDLYIQDNRNGPENRRTESVALPTREGCWMSHAIAGTRRVLVEHSPRRQSKTHSRRAIGARKLRWKVGIAALIVATTHWASAPVSLADCHGVGSPSSGTITVNFGSSQGAVAWNVGSGIAANPLPAVSMNTYGHTDMAPWCVTTWFDWSTASGHFDARAVRNCLPGTNFGHAFQDVPGGGRTLSIGMQKWGVCAGPFNVSTPQQSCVNGAGTRTYPIVTS